LPQNHAHHFTKRIGYTTYYVTSHFNKTSTETAKDKLIRIIKNDTTNQKENQLAK